MNVYRLTRKKYANELNGKGAAKFGNRWNSKGVEMVYTADSRSLAMAEVAVHLTLANLPKDFVMLEIEIPQEISISKLSETDYPDHWNSHPPRTTSQKFGDYFIQLGAYCVLRVPSAVVLGDFNFLINPNHELFKKISIVNQSDFLMDSRMFQ